MVEFSLTPALHQATLVGMDEEGSSELGATGWPARLAPSVVARTLTPSTARRSYSIDVTSSHGRVRLAARGRDVVLPGGAVVAVTDEVTLDIEYTEDDALTIVALSVGPRRRAAAVDAALRELVGRPGRSGFRAAAARSLDGMRVPPGVLLRSMLHDVPIAVAIRSAAEPPDEPYTSAVPHRAPVDLCAGYRQGGVLERWTSVRGPRRLGVGPRAEPIAAP